LAPFVNVHGVRQVEPLHCRAGAGCRRGKSATNQSPDARARPRPGEGASRCSTRPVYLVQQLRRDPTRRRTGAHAGREEWSTGLRRNEISRRRRRSDRSSFRRSPGAMCTGCCGFRRRDGRAFARHQSAGFTVSRNVAHRRGARARAQRAARDADTIERNAIRHSSADSSP
jgi:hypothetical protein